MLLELIWDSPVLIRVIGRLPSSYIITSSHCISQLLLFRTAMTRTAFATVLLCFVFHLTDASVVAPVRICKFVNTIRGTCCSPCRRCCIGTKCETSSFCSKSCLSMSACRVCGLVFIQSKTGTCCRLCKKCCKDGVCMVGNCYHRCYHGERCKYNIGQRPATSGVNLTVAVAKGPVARG